MSTRQEESKKTAEGAGAVESPSADQMQGASGPTAPEGVTAAAPRDTNADDTVPGAGDQDIDTAGTEADEQSAAHDALGFPPSDPASPAKNV